MSAPMSLEVAPAEAMQTSEAIETLPANATLPDQELQSILNATPPQDVLSRILSAIQLGSKDSLAQYIRSYRLPPNGVLPPLLSSLLLIDPSLELLWLAPPPTTAPPALPSLADFLGDSFKPLQSVHQMSAPPISAPPSDVAPIAKMPSSLPATFDSSISSSTAQTDTSPTAIEYTTTTMPQDAPVPLPPPPLIPVSAAPDTAAREMSSVEVVKTYQKPKKEGDVKQQQRERLEQLIDQLVQIADSADRPDLLPCLHHVFAEVSLQRQNRVLHKLAQETFTKLLTFVDRAILHASELAKERTADTSIGLDAALLALVLMNADALPNPVYAEERLELVTRLIRDHLGCHVFPVLDPSLAAASQRHKSESEVSVSADDEEIVVRRPSKGRKKTTQTAPKTTSVICNKLTQLFEGVQEFLSRRNVNDAIILDLSSSSLNVLFLQPLPNIQAALTSLQLSALNVVRTIYSRYPLHRDNLLNDVFGHMLRLPTATRTLRSYLLPDDDKRIQTISALVMQLLQASTTLPGLSTYRRLEITNEEQGDAHPNSYDTASRTAAQFMTSCLHKCIVKSEETDAKGVLLNLLADLLAVISLPEWPAASILLQALVGACLHVLRQPSNDPRKDNRENKELAALKAVALDLFKEMAPAFKQLALSSQGNVGFRPQQLHSKEEEKVDCMCGVDRGIAETREMICCSSCNVWYHTSCVSVSGAVFAGAVDWFCDDCLFAKQMASDPSALYSAPPPPAPTVAAATDIDVSDLESEAKEEKKEEEKKKKEEEISEAQEEKTAKERGRKGAKQSTAKKGGAKRKKQGEGNEEQKEEGEEIVLDHETKKKKKRGRKKKEKQKDEANEKEEEKKERPPPTPEQLEQYKLVQLLLNYLLPRQADDSNALYARRFILCQFAAESGGDEHTLNYCMGQWHLVPSPTQARLSRRGTAKILLRLLVLKNLSKAFDAILLAVATSLMDASQLLRSKSIRTLTAIVQVDPSVLALERVRLTVQQRTQDISKVVREATLELVGKYIHSAPQLTEQYFETIAKRIADTGVLVRRKAVSILVEILHNQPESSRVAEICALLVGRVNDKDESIKKQVSTSFMELWFRDGASAQQLQQRVQQIVQTMASARSAPWFSSLLGKLLGKREDKRQQQLAATCQRMCEILFNRLLAHEAARAGLEKTSPKFIEETKAMIDTIVALSVFCKASPHFLLPHFTHLSYYLATTDAQPKGPHEPKVVELVAGMVAQVLPLLQNPSPDSVKTLEENLSRLVCQQVMSAVPACVHCLGVLASTVSTNTALMVDLYNRFVGVLEKGKGASKLDKGAVVRALFTLALLCKDYDYAHRAALPSIAERVWPLYVYYSESFKGEAQIAVTAIQGMGALWIAFPSLLPAASSLIRLTLAHTSPAPLRIHMCRALLATLQHSADSILSAASVEATEDTSEWIVSTHDATGAVAEHAERAAELLGDPLDDVRNESLSLVTVMLKQGLIHPMQCIAQLIALNADQRPAIALRAFHLLAQIDDRHPDMLWNRLVDGIRSSYSLQRSAFHTAVAVKLEDKELHSVWERVYLLPKKQSAQRIERSLFLAALVKHFDIPDNANIDLDMQVYFAEVLAYLPYRIPEDPLSVVYHINKLLAMRGDALLAQLKSHKDAKTLPKGVAAQCANFSLLLTLKNFLKILYCLSENKCRHFLPSASSAVMEGSKEKKEKQLNPRSEVLQRPSPFPSIIATDALQLGERFKALMKADESDALMGVQAPLRKQKRGRKPKEKKNETASDSEEAEEIASKKSAAKKGRRKRTRVVNEDEEGDRDDGDESADEYQPH